MNTERKIQNLIDSYLITEQEIKSLADNYSISEIESELDIKEAALNHAFNSIVALGVTRETALEMIDEVSERRSKKRGSL